MRTISLDLRERIVTAYDNKEGTREQIAKRFCVSLDMVKKLLQQRRHLGDLRPQHHRAGRKPKLAEHHPAMRALLAEKPDLTLKEVRSALGLNCSITAIYYALVALGLTYKKRHSAPANGIARTSQKLGVSGKSAKPALIRQSSSSSMSPARKQT